MSDEAFWQDLVNQEHTGTLQEGEKTASMLAEKLGKSRGQTYEILAKWMKDGKVSRRPVIFNGRKTWAYRPVEPAKNGKGK